MECGVAGGQRKNTSEKAMSFEIGKNMHLPDLEQLNLLLRFSL